MTHRDGAWVLLCSAAWSLHSSTKHQHSAGILCNSVLGVWQVPTRIQLWSLDGMFCPCRVGQVLCSKDAGLIRTVGTPGFTGEFEPWSCTPSFKLACRYNLQEIPQISSSAHSSTLARIQTLENAQPFKPSLPATAQGPFIVHQGPNSLGVFLVEVNKDLNQHLRPGLIRQRSRGKIGGIDGNKGRNRW